MLCTRLIERGQLLLARANSSSRKAGRQDSSRVLPSQNDSSATALHGSSPSGPRPTANRALPDGNGASGQSSNASSGKGATDFRVHNLRNGTPPAALSSSLPVLNRHALEEDDDIAVAPAAAPAAPQVPIHRQRRAKLIRDPTNTCHRPRNRRNHLSQSMDFTPGQRSRPRVLAQLFTCCAPVTSLFRRSGSYDSMQSDGNRQSSSQAQERSRVDAERISSSSSSRAPSVRDSADARYVQRDHLSPTATAVGVADDRTTTSSKTPSPASSRGRLAAGAPDDTDDANESDWLVSRSDKELHSADFDDFPSPGSGLPGIRQRPQGLAGASAMPAPGASTYSDLGTGASDSVYRTPPTSVGDMSGSLGNAQHTQGQADAADSEQNAAIDTPSNTMSKLYLDDEAYEHVPRRLTLETSSADPESIGEDDFETDEEIGLRTEITSPPGNVATASSERLVTHVENEALLPPLAAPLKDRKCLVLDLDETLVHSSFREVDQPDYVVPVVLEGQEHSVYVVKRPGVDEFISVMGQFYEVVVFTASLSMYADPVLDLLDKKGVVHHRLFRESCNLYNGNYVKDLSRLGRDVTQSIIIDNSPASYAFHPNNAIGISTWLNDPMDTELRDLIPFLIDLTTVDDVSAVLSLTHNHVPLAQLDRM
ncbi:hypothetical protein GGF46_002238 [Coemansia sp. RSA 552]|nr:hypothetical protein GGF46_002238 [Coemansia sp. RSA 552]